MADALLPVVMLASLVILLGVLGNSVVCYICGYRLDKSVLNNLVLALAALDLIGCVACVPLEVTELRNRDNKREPGLCLIQRFLRSILLISSILILVLIAVQRYRRICRPLSRHISLRQCRIAIVGAIIIAVLLSWPSLFLFGEQSVVSAPEGNVTVKMWECGVKDAMKDSAYPVVYLTLLFLLFFVCSALLGGLYVRIACRIWRARKIQTDLTSRTKSASLPDCRRLNATGSAVSFGGDCRSCAKCNDCRSCAKCNGCTNCKSCTDGGKGVATMPNCRRVTAVVAGGGCNNCTVGGKGAATMPNCRRVKDVVAGGGCNNCNNCKSCTDGGKGAATMPNCRRVKAVVAGGDCNNCNKCTGGGKGAATMPNSRRMKNNCQNCQKCRDCNSGSTCSHGVKCGSTPMPTTLLEELTRSLQLRRKRDAVNFLMVPTNSFRRKKRAAFSRKRTTVIMFLMTLTSVVSYLPYILASIAYGGASRRVDAESNAAVKTLLELCLKSFWISSVANPFIYGFCNRRLKTECGRLWQAVSCRRRDSRETEETSDTPPHT